MISKKCFKCKKVKPLNQFHKHKMMLDGHLNKCAVCVREYVASWLLMKKNDPEWVSRERKRCRIKHRNNRQYPNRHLKTKATAVYNKRYPEKRKAQYFAHHNLKRKTGKEFHHWSYNEKHYLDVIQMHPKDHKKAHRFLRYDSKSKMYKNINGVLLNTKSKHKNYIMKMISIMED